MKDPINNKYHLKRKEIRPLSYYTDGIAKGDSNILGQAITLVESEQARHKELAGQIVSFCTQNTIDSFRLGITGSPGVGKSSFINVFGKEVLKKGHRVAILAVDPSSQHTHGSILGDKTRMSELIGNPDVFIRPTPAGDTLGGVARKTRECILLCEAAGYDFIIVETVGVGQSEIAVHSMVDFFTLMILPGAGDELQGIKRGVMEMADGIIIHKADGTNQPLASIAEKQCKNALHLFPPKENGWVPFTHKVSSLSELGHDEIYRRCFSYQDIMKDNGQWSAKRSSQNVFWFDETIRRKLQDLLLIDPSIEKVVSEMKQCVADQEISPFEASEKVMRSFINVLRNKDLDRLL